MCLKVPFRVAALTPLFALALMFGPVTAQAGQEDAPGPVSGELVDFSRDIWPILNEKCLVCHGPEDAKNDFRVDLEDSMGDYIEAGDLESSSLWGDYLVTDDVDMRMPPADSETGQLTGAQLALLKVWIEEGASWGEIEGLDAEPAEPEVPLSESMSDAAKWWRLGGLFHPASVHFPIALLVVSAGFVVLSFINRTAFEPVAFHCLWIGALGAVAASVLGWSYAQHEGYGAMSFDLGKSAIDRHRWLGIAATVVAVILIPTARSVRRTGDTGMRLLWMLGSFVAVGAVSIAGYQGGELTYGEDHYIKEYELLFPALETEQSSEGIAAEEVEKPESEESESEELESEAEATASDEVDNGESAKSEETATSSGDAEKPSGEEAAPKQEESAATSEDPASEDPASEDPASEDPASEDPASEDPTSDDPTSDDPTSDDPTSDDPTSDDPTSDDPTSDDPTSEDPASEDPPKADKPAGKPKADGGAGTSESGPEGTGKKEA